MCREVSLRELEYAAGAPLYLDTPNDIEIDQIAAEEPSSSQRRRRKPKSRKLEPRERFSSPDTFVLQGESE